MDLDRLRNMLNIKPKEGNRANPTEPDPMDFLGDSGGRPVGGATSVAPEASPHTIVPNDLWERSQGDKILRHNKDARETEAAPEALSDFFNMAYQTNPQLEEHVTDQRRKEFVSTTMDTPDFNALHRCTEMNALASELAAVEVARGWAALREKDKGREERNDKQRQRGKPVDPARDKRRGDMDMLRAATQALRRADDKIEQLDDALNALGMGTGGTGQQGLDLTRMTAAYERIKDSHRLQEIFNRAGKYINFALAQQRQKCHHGYEDMVGVRLDDSIDRLLDEEVVTLVDPDLELDALRRLAEREMLALEYRGTEPVGKGPIVYVVDESGSMSGAPIAEAKAMALALARVAKHQKRWCVLVGYSGGTQGTKLALKPNRWDEAMLLEWLEHFFGAGTDMDVPLDELPNKWWPEFLAQGMPRGKTDLILNSDAICHVPPDMERKFLEWKAREKVRCISLILAASAGGLARVSDEVHLLPRFGLEQTAIQNCLSI